MIELVATLVVIAIMLGVVWRIYYCWRNEELLALVDNVEAQLGGCGPRRLHRSRHGWIAALAPSGGMSFGIRLGPAR